MATNEPVGREVRSLPLSVAERFEQWIEEHGRVYKDAAEKERRLKIFADNMEYVESFNASGDHGYTLGINLFSDLTNEEFSAMYSNPCLMRATEELPSSTTQ